MGMEQGTHGDPNEEQIAREPAKEKKWFTGVGERLLSSIKTIREKMVSVDDTLVDSVKDKTKEVFSELEATRRDLFEGVKEGFSKASELVKSIGAGYVDHVSDFFDRKEEELNGVSENLAAPAEVLKAASEAERDESKNLANGVNGAIDGLAGFLSSLDYGLEVVTLVPVVAYRVAVEVVAPDSEYSKRVDAAIDRYKEWFPLSMDKMEIADNLHAFAKKLRKTVK